MNGPVGNLVANVEDETAARIAAVQQEFSPANVYLNSATVGLPPRRTVDAVRAALDDWQQGQSIPSTFDADVARSRELYAQLVNIAPRQVSVGSQASVYAGLVAASVPDGAEILVASGDFTSVLFPFLAQADRGVRVREVELGDLVGAIRPETYLVAVSAVQSGSGEIADLDGLARAVANGTRVYLDTTQAVGWLPIDAASFTWTVCSGYKFLLAPRGTCFATTTEVEHPVIPHTAGWYAGDEVWNSIYGTPLRLADDARRFDVSPAWFSWVGQARSLELLVGIGRSHLHRHATRLAAEFETRAGLPVSGSAIVSLETTEDAAERLRQAGIACAQRAGRTRVSFHLHNTLADADELVSACAPAGSA
ncbi:putative aminotransferase [Microlunatus phosphovorus NM-1]|uniref:Putative aminotransferase n=1 Tax=Microlunatus phosphovorus (strain ATCC 700054 / DSM 10555 / JCM 9379 / NBRC 101784 / NCIMB 13414 / VKM Ac-1990 / NM-1) TaxID=1032480 RepID=F5XQQ1_MICPN|nr:aminotransferase class V-fold PLP-dependent enzyme [Microlunatus phosphovorus]BAK34551.1 putative aminotransferase [Microlunatus phosphovorus NM-1]